MSFLQNINWLFVLFNVVTVAGAVILTRRTERKRTAEQLFEKAVKLLADKHYGEAVEFLRFMRDNLVSPLWFDNFLDTDKTITRGKYMGVLNDSFAKLRDPGNISSLKQERLSDEELARRIKRIWELTEPPEGYDREKMVNDVVDAFLNKTPLKNT